MRLWQSSIYLNLVLTFLLSIIPMYILSLYINMSGAASVRQEITNSMQSRVHFYLSSYEAELSRVTKSMRDFINDGDLSTLSNLYPNIPTFERFKMLNRLESKLFLLNNSSQYISSSKLYIPSMGITIHGSGYDEAAIPAKEISEIRSVQYKTLSPFTMLDDRLFMGSLFPLGITAAQAPTSIIKVEISLKSLRDVLKQIPTTVEGGAVLFAREQDWHITSTQEAREAALIQTLKKLWENKSNDHKAGSERIKIDNRFYLVTYEPSEMLDATLLVYVPEKQILDPLSHYFVMLLVLSVLSVAVIIFFSYWIYRMIHKPLRSLVSAFRRVERGNMDISIPYKTAFEFGYLYRQFNAMISRLNTLIQEVYEQKIHSQRAELKQLQSQINPHFLYNSFFVLKRMIAADDNKNAINFVEHLGNYFQYITRNADDEVTLEAEWLHARTYADIQMARFRKRLRTDFVDMPSTYASLNVPRLIIQPILENAYQYGLQNKITDGIIRVSFEVKMELICIAVEDNGEELTDEQLSMLEAKLNSHKEHMETTGLINVHRRLQLKFGTDAGVLVKRSSLGGLRTEICIPIREVPNVSIVDH
ncbi:sensor histidine kinase [Paenibacillus terrigena]|uniref:sensor histidine kinase n=1 Tax=Paenibacillus terrigena TaxID=369333 RepID=UPI0003822291|nr:histidine kinase [Paenibacillus terrigena]